MVFKLISPIKIVQYNSEEDCEYVVSENSIELYRGVLELLNKDRFSKFTHPGEISQGLMYWYGENDNDPMVNNVRGDIVKRTITFAFPTVEIINGKIMGVCYCNFESENLTEEEKANFEPTVHQELIDKLIDYVSGQYSDGWGESLEQNSFKYNGEITMVSFWTSNKNWKMEIQDFDIPHECSVVEELIQLQKTLEAEGNFELSNKIVEVRKALEL